MLKFHPDEFVDKAGHTVILDPITILAFRPINNDTTVEHVSFKIFKNEEIVAANHGDFNTDLKFMWNEFALERDEKLTAGAKRLKYFLRDKATVLRNGAKVIDY